MGIIITTAFNIFVLIIALSNVQKNPTMINQNIIFSMIAMISFTCIIRNKYRQAYIHKMNAHSIPPRNSFEEVVYGEGLPQSCIDSIINKFGEDGWTKSVEVKDNTSYYLAIKRRHIDVSKMTFAIKVARNINGNWYIERNDGEKIKVPRRNIIGMKECRKESKGNDVL